MKQLQQYWLQIQPLNDFDECKLAVAKVVTKIFKEAESLAYLPTLTHRVIGRRSDTLSCALISVEGIDIDNFVNRWTGTIKWVCKSPYHPQYRANHWYLKVDALRSSDIAINSSNRNDVIFDIIYKNRFFYGDDYSYIVRATHMPTGLTAYADEEKTEYLNKKLALAKLEQMLDKRNEKSPCLNKTRVFVGEGFYEKYKHKTEKNSEYTNEFSDFIFANQLKQNQTPCR